MKIKYWWLGIIGVFSASCATENAELGKPWSSVIAPYDDNMFLAEAVVREFTSSFEENFKKIADEKTSLIQKACSKGGNAQGIYVDEDNRTIYVISKEAELASERSDAQGAADALQGNPTYSVVFRARYIITCN